MMMPANYTSERICRVLGLPGFMPTHEEWESGLVLRFLETGWASEACYSIHREVNDFRVTARVACEPISRQQSIWPKPAPFRSFQAQCSPLEFAELADLLRSAIDSPRKSTVICDGGMSHAVVRYADGSTISFQDRGGIPGFDAFTSRMFHLTRAWFDAPFFHHALLPDGFRKQYVETLVLGPDEVVAPMLAALAEHHRVEEKKRNG